MCSSDLQFRRDFAITMHSAINSVEAITDLKPVLLVNISDRNFICGDAPIVIFNNIKFSNHSSDGLLTPGLQIFYPLNNELVLLILDQKAYTLDFDYDSICYVNKKSDIDSINKMQFINALDFVLFSEIKQKKNIEKIFREIEKEIQNDVQRNFGSYKKGKEFLQKNKIWRQFYYLSKYRTHKQNLTFISIDEEYARNQIDKYNKILEIDQNAIPTRDKALADKTIARLKKAHERMTVSLKESSTK